MAFSYTAETVVWIFGSLDIQQYGGLCGIAMNPVSNKADLWDKHYLGHCRPFLIVAPDSMPGHSPMFSAC